MSAGRTVIPLDNPPIHPCAVFQQCDDASGLIGLVVVAFVGIGVGGDIGIAVVGAGGHGVGVQEDDLPVNAASS